MISKNIPSNLEFIEIPGGSYELGWRFSDRLSPKVIESIADFCQFDELLERFSGQREIDIQTFSIAKTSIAIEDLLGNVYELEAIDTLEQLCTALDAALQPKGLRVPTEDELEIACGGELFAWGMKIPDGMPYPEYTTFSQHKEPNHYGLILNHNPYEVETVRHAFKLGDGGESI